MAWTICRPWVTGSVNSMSTLTPIIDITRAIRAMTVGESGTETRARHVASSPTGMVSTSGAETASRSRAVRAVHALASLQRRDSGARRASPSPTESRCNVAASSSTGTASEDPRSCRTTASAASHRCSSRARTTSRVASS